MQTYFLLIANFVYKAALRYSLFCKDADFVSRDQVALDLEVGANLAGLNYTS